MLRFARSATLLVLLFLAISLHLFAEPTNVNNNSIILTPNADVGEVTTLEVSPELNAHKHLVITVDGQLTLIDTKSGDLLWSTSIPPGGPLISSHAQQEKVQVIPSVTGNLYLIVRGEKGVQKLPLTARELVDLAPFVSADKTLYLSSKQTTSFSIDLKTGSTQKTPQILRTKPKERKDEVMMIRVDYAIHAIDSASGKVKWNATFSECHPSNYQQSSANAVGFSSSEGHLYYLSSRTSAPSIFQFSSQPYQLFSLMSDAKSVSFFRMNMIYIPIGSEANGDIFISKNRYAFEVTNKILGKRMEALPASTSTPSVEVISIDEDEEEDNELVSRGVIGVHKINPFTYGQCLNEDVISNARGQFIPRIEDSKPTAEAQPKDTKLNLSYIYTAGVAAALIVIVGGVIALKSKSSSKVPGSKKKKLKKKKAASIAKEEKPEVEEEEPEEEKKAPAVAVPEVSSTSSSEKAETPTPEPVNTVPATPVSPKPLVVKGPGGVECVKVGRILVSKRMLGTGSNGTVVYEGYLEDHNNRKIAVKRMLKEFFDTAQSEISLLIESDTHVNVIRYYAKEDDEQFVYLALEFCPYTLDGLVAEKKKKKLDRMSLIVDLVKAVEHIHNINIVHRDLKPQNILVTEDFKVKLSDMGLGKKLSSNKTSFHTTGGKSGGTVGWQAPEVMDLDDEAGASTTRNTQQRKTRAVDIFALGCIIYYVLTDGQHPFGERVEREFNITHDITKMGNSGLPAETLDLIEQMISRDPAKRPKASHILDHCMFWNDTKRITFLGDVSDQLGKEQTTSAVYHVLQNHSKTLFNGHATWDKSLDKAVVDGVLKYRKYDYTKVWDLMRCIRNIRSHYREYDESVQKLIRPPDGIFAYFNCKYPRLFYIVYSEVRKSEWRTRAIFKPYFPN